MAPSADADIRLLTREDLDAAFTLSSTAGWNQRLEDWRMLLQLAPAGSFCAMSGGRLVGTAMGVDYGAFGWIAMMLVDPACRGRGLGARLLEAAMGAVPPDLPIRLDATPLGRPLYQRYGFEDEMVLSRRVRQPSDRERPAALPEPSSSIRPMSPSDLPIVIDRDREVFGGNRRVVLEWVLEHAPEYAYFDDGDAARPGYCVGRPGRLFDQIGPVVARNHDVATALVSAAAGAAGSRPIVVDSIDSRRTFSTWLLAAGFDVQRPLFRMRRPGSAAPHAPDDASRRSLFEFAILGPEFG